MLSSGAAAILRRNTSMMHSRSVLITHALGVFAAVACAAVAVMPLCAQGVRRAASQTADSAVALAGSGDTSAAVRLLEAAVRDDPKSAAMWHLLGLYSWRIVGVGVRGGYISDPRMVRMISRADSALRLATRLSPDSARYWLTLARFNLQSGIGSARLAGGQEMDRALTAARLVGDTSLMAEAADEVGLATWRRYETTANRALVENGKRVQLQTDGLWQRGRAKDYLGTFAKRIEPPTGAQDRNAAVDRFRLAAELAPTSLAYSRHLFMSLATGHEWELLLTIASTRSARSSFDGQARLARGLALHRLGRDREAKFAFDSAMGLMDELEVSSLFRTDRLVAPAGRMTARPDDPPKSQISASHRTLGAMFWALNDPDSRTSENESELEFWSRVIQAEWTWSDEVNRISGADTDRGDIFVRYGPPDEELTLAGTPSVQQDFSPSKKLFEGGSSTGGILSTSQSGGATLAWIYRSGDVFFFDMAVGYGTARLPLTDQQYVNDYKSIRPATWDNLAVPRRVASIPARVSRFRGNIDSTDIVIGARIPIRAIVIDTGAGVDASTDIDGFLRTDFRIVDGAARTMRHDTSQSLLSPDSLVRDRARQWTSRIGVGASFVRLVAEYTSRSGEAPRAANALLAVAAERNSGFGLSDVLLTVPSGRTSSTLAERWSNLGAQASTGTYGVGEKIGVVWETYALADSSGANRYRVSITVERIKREGAAGLALRVIDGVGTLLRQGSSAGDKVTVAFDRLLPARGTQVDNITLDGLGDARGDYRLRVDVKDVIANRTTSRETRLTVQ